jgi:hypothetical protein
LNRIVLFYGFTPIADPDAVRLWQRALCEKLGLTGRILLSKDGINATVGSARYWEVAMGVGYWAVVAAVTATAVPFAAVVLGLRAAETALNRRDAAVAAGQP